jgi:membrane protein required for colicin V production
MEGLNYLDIFVIVIVLLLSLKGFLTGFIKELFALLGIVGGVFIGSSFSKDIGNFINDNIFEIANNSALSATGFIISFLLFWFVLYVFGSLIQKVVNSAGLGVFDKIAGMIVSGSKIFLIFSIIAFGLTSVEAINKNIEDKVENSVVFPILVKTGSYIVKIDPEELVDNVNNSVENAREDIQDSIKSGVSAVKEDIKKLGN